ncbi:MAG TPA: RHS repeat-associated core domain-containing protein, partial [Flavipsychrobacter sp.]|nr:RHS repeat-associated core domain-containing protein [Flavipsychrobacter sp.]
SSTTAGVDPENQYKHQGKLLQEELGMQLYDFHARQYDPQIGRFWGIDPMDQFPSGYTGMGNDPANMIDPSGMLGLMYDASGAMTLNHPDHPVTKWKRQEAHSAAWQKLLELENANAPKSNELTVRGDQPRSIYDMNAEFFASVSEAFYERVAKMDADEIKVTDAPGVNQVDVNGTEMQKDKADGLVNDAIAKDDAETGVDAATYANNASENIASLLENGGAANYLPQYDGDGEKGNENPKGRSTKENANIVVGTLGISMDVQNYLVDLAAKGDESIKSLGVVKGVKIFGNSLNVIQMLSVGNEIRTKGYNHERAVDIAIGALSLSNPAGWVIGLLYNAQKIITPMPSPPKRVDYIKTNATQNKL